jgi:hypothetical protein
MQKKLPSEDGPIKRSSWIILGICILLVIGLIGAYFASQTSSTTLTKAQALQMVEKMQEALRHKNVNAIMSYIAPGPDTRIANVNQDQLRGILAHYIRNADSLRAEIRDPAFSSGDSEAVLEFDLTVYNNGQDSVKEDYKGHITLHLKRVEITHLLGMYKTKEWRIVGAETTGPTLDNFGDY